MKPGKGICTNDAPSGDHTYTRSELVTIASRFARGSHSNAATRSICTSTAHSSMFTMSQIHTARGVRASLVAKKRSSNDQAMRREGGVKYGALEVRYRALAKKLRQIEDLERKRSEGTRMDAQQTKKLKRKEYLEAEMKNLEKLISGEAGDEEEEDEEEDDEEMSEEDEEEDDDDDDDDEEEEEDEDDEEEEEEDEDEDEEESSEEEDEDEDEEEDDSESE